jgi:hypothetical protein
MLCGSTDAAYFEHRIRQTGLSEEERKYAETGLQYGAGEK